MKRLLNPKTNSTGIVGTASGLYGIAQALWNALHLHTATVSPTVIYAFLIVAASVYQWMRNTPIADPKDGNGQRLVPLVAARFTGTFTDVARDKSGELTFSMPPPLTSMPPVEVSGQVPTQPTTGAAS